MENLLNTLFEQTVDLKNEFLSKTLTWAENYYNTLLVRKSWSELQWCEYFGLEPRLANPNTSMEFLTFPSGFHNTSNAKRYKNLKNDIRVITNQTLESYLKKEEEKALNHYEQSIKKLHNRILSKGLNKDNIKTTTGRVGVNIETTLTDGEKTVRAWTIVASGDIQRPHYRYLVK
jgi:hypothetical protein